LTSGYFFNLFLDKRTKEKGKMKMNINSFKEDAKLDGLDVWGITGGTNGYPVPGRGWFVTGFENFEKVEKFAEKWKCEVSEARWKDGWAVVEILRDYIFQPLQITSEWYGDEYQIYNEIKGNTFDEFLNWEYGYKNEKEARADNEDNETRLVDMKNLYTELSKVDFKKFNAVVYCDGEVIALLKKEGELKFYNDCEHIAIGVSWYHEDHHEEEEEEEEEEE